MNLTAVELGKKIKAGEVKVVDAVLDVFAAIEAVEENIHSYVTVLDKEKVLDELRYYKMNNQICIVNQETLNRVITFKRAYEVETNGR